MYEIQIPGKLQLVKLAIKSNIIMYSIMSIKEIEHAVYKSPAKNSQPR